MGDGMKITYPLLYLAYGANTERSHMRHRCPGARFRGTAVLRDYVMVFRGVADVERRAGARVVCGLWELGYADVAALDRFEGVPNLYVKRYAEIIVKGRRVPALYYVMTGYRDDQHEPPRSYEATLRSGYAKCGLPVDQIDGAIAEAKNSASREKTYFGQWVRRDREAKAWPVVPFGGDDTDRRLTQQQAERELRGVSLMDKMFPHAIPRRVRPPFGGGND